MSRRSPVERKPPGARSTATIGTSPPAIRSTPSFGGNRGGGRLDRGVGRDPLGTNSGTAPGRSRQDGPVRFNTDGHHDEHNGHGNWGHGYHDKRHYYDHYDHHGYYSYPYRPYHRSIYPWRPYDYYNHCTLDRYYRHYRPYYYYGYGYYWPYHHAYVSVYYDSPVVYRYHDVYLYHDVDTGFNQQGISGYDTYYEDPVEPYGPSDPGPAQDYELSEFNGNPDYAGWPVDPPDGVGPPLDMANDYDPAMATLSPVGEGIESFRSGDFEGARSAFVRAILADERDGYAKFLYGLANFAVGDYTVAAISWRRAALTSDLFLERPPDVRYLYGDLASFEAQLDRLSRVAREHQDDRDVQFTLAFLLYATGEPRVAAELFERLAGSDSADLLARRLADVCAQAAESFQPPPAVVDVP